MGILVLQGPHGPVALSDGGQSGSGVPRYYGMRGYQQGSVPRVVGARYFGPEEEADFDADDKQVPIAMGNELDGGRPVYQQRIYAAAKKNPKVVGLTPSNVDTVLKPKVVT